MPRNLQEPKEYITVTCWQRTARELNVQPFYQYLDQYCLNGDVKKQFKSVMESKVKHWQDDSRNFEKLTWKLAKLSVFKVMGEDCMNKLRNKAFLFQNDVWNYFIQSNKHWKSNNYVPTK